MVALRKPERMTVAEFRDWQPIDGRRWQLIDGEPVAMAPASENHAAIQAEAAIILGLHLRVHRPVCRVLAAPGVTPRVRATVNERIPDLAITCTPPSGGRTVQEPVVVVEVLSPSNEQLTRANVWAYTSIPSVAEILLLSSTSIEGELWRRGADGAWPSQPQMLDALDPVRLESIGFAERLVSFYRTTSLAA